MKQRVKHLLLWSQKYTKTDMLYLARGGFWVGLAQVCNAGLSLILIVAFANLLPKETYGIYRYILSIVGILSILTLTGMNSAVARAVARGNHHVLIPAVNYQLKWNLGMLIVFLILGGYYWAEGNMTFALSFFILSICVPTTLACNTYGAFLEGRKRFDIANVLNITATFIYSAGVLSLLFFTDSVPLLIMIYGATTAIPSIIFYLYVVKRFTLHGSHAYDIEETNTYGRELTYLRFFDPIVSQIDKIILGQVWGAGALATYALAQAIPNRVTLFTKSWIGIGFPKFAEKTPAALDRVFMIRIAHGLLVGTCIFVLYFIAAPYIFTYILPQYIDGIFYSQILAIAFIVALPNRYMSLLLTSQGFSKELFQRTVFMSIVTVVLYAALGIPFGVTGMIVANVSTGIVGFFVNIALWKYVCSRHT